MLRHRRAILTCEVRVTEVPLSWNSDFREPFFWYSWLETEKKKKKIRRTSHNEIYRPVIRRTFYNVLFCLFFFGPLPNLRAVSFIFFISTLVITFLSQPFFFLCLYKPAFTLSRTKCLSCSDGFLLRFPHILPWHTLPPRPKSCNCASLSPENSPHAAAPFTAKDGGATRPINRPFPPPVCSHGFAVQNGNTQVHIYTGKQLPHYAQYYRRVLNDLSFVFVHPNPIVPEPG